MDFEGASYVVVRQPRLLQGNSHFVRIDMNSSNRTIRLTFRVSEQEMQEIEKLCKYAGVNVSDLLRMAVFTASIKSPDIPLIDQQSFVELKRIGTNINQIAKAINSGYGNPEQLIPSVQAIQKDLDRLTQYLVHHDSKN